MRPLIALLTALSAALSVAADSPTQPTYHERIENADTVAIVAFPARAQDGITKEPPRSHATLLIDAAVERLLKGHRQGVIKIRLQTPTDQKQAQEGGRFLILAKKSGDVYVPDTFFGFNHIYGAQASDDNH